MRVLLFILVFSATLMTSMFSPAQYSEFTDTEGRTITATLIRYDFEKEMVRLKPKGRPTQVIPINVFSGNDQDYIKLWQIKQYFMNDRWLEVRVSRVKDDASGGTPMLRSSRNNIYGYSEAMNWGAKDYMYKVKLKNWAHRPMDNVTVEYVFFYEQEVWGVNPYKDKRDVEGTLRGKTSISIPEDEEQVLLTDAVQLKSFRERGVGDLRLTRLLNGEVVREYYSKRSLDGKLKGIILKITLEHEDFDPIIRTIRYPKGLDKEWPDDPVDDAAETDAAPKNSFDYNENDSLFSW